MNWMNVITKGIGIAGLGVVAYDSHVAGKINADSHRKKVQAGMLSEGYIDSNMINIPSTTQSKMKKTWFKWKQDDNIIPFFSSIGGYVKGFASMLVDNVIPFALATATLLTKGKVSKYCGLGLAGYGLFSLVSDVFSFSKTPRLDKKY